MKAIEEMQEPNKCPMCKRNFKMRRELNNHWVLKHSEPAVQIIGYLESAPSGLRDCIKKKRLEKNKYKFISKGSR